MAAYDMMVGLRAAYCTLNNAPEKSLFGQFSLHEYTPRYYFGHQCCLKPTVVHLIVAAYMPNVNMCLPFKSCALDTKRNKHLYWECAR